MYCREVITLKSWSVLCLSTNHQKDLLTILEPSSLCSIESINCLSPSYADTPRVITIDISKHVTNENTLLIEKTFM